jgi:hypothetical protein
MAAAAHISQLTFNTINRYGYKGTKNKLLNSVIKVLLEYTVLHSNREWA